MLFAFALLLCILILPARSFACACCAEPGTYSISVRKPGNSELEVLRKIKFADANLYMDAAGEEAVKGISSIAENYSIEGLLAGSAWKFNFRDDQNRSGSLRLPLPSTMVAFEADIHDEKQQGGNGPLLYKELRFKHRVQSGSGIFQKGIVPRTEFFLVLQGRGNNCLNASDFTHWRLEINGLKASYAYYGKLKQ
jgi:hypothetical protein